MVEDKFYHLICKETITWDSGSVHPVPHLNEIIEVTRAGSFQGYVYPPIVTTATETVSDKGIARIEDPHSQRSSLLWGMPPTHELQIRSSEDKQSLRIGLSGFIIHFLGMLYGCRSQFYDWWIDGRLSMRTTNDIILPLGVIEQICATAIDSWRAWTDRSQRVMINALYLHNRIPGLEWDWERFGHAYQVFDAVHAVGRAERGLADSPHRARWQGACDHFGLHSDPSTFQAIVDLRNDLIHEAIWAGGMPGSSQLPVAQLPIFMRNYNTRLILAVLGVVADYVRSDWQHLGQEVLRPSPP